MPSRGGRTRGQKRDLLQWRNPVPILFRVASLLPRPIKRLTDRDSVFADRDFLWTICLEHFVPCSG